MSSRLRNLATTIKAFGSRTTVHGLLHIFQSHNRMRKLFWFILLLIAMSAGFYHTLMTVLKFMENPATSQLKFMSEEAVFPDVTICNLKPASEMLSLRYWRLPQYLNSSWQFFDNWQYQERLQLPTEDVNEADERVRKIFRQQLQVMWVSGDTRDIGHSDKTMILYCRYNGITCDHRNFTLVQSSKFWNCYTFDLNSQNSTNHGINGRGAELDIVLFTDSYAKKRIEDLDNETIARLDEKHKNVKSKEPLSMKEYINSKVLNCVDQILRQGAFESSGLRLYFHEKLIHPLLNKEFLDVQSGKSTTITLKPIRHSLVSGSSRKCSKPPHEKIKYVRYFAHGSQDIGTREYIKTENDFVVEAKQKIVFDNCGCFSHRYPFQVNNSQLCYYVSPEHWKFPPDNLFRNIKCHDKWILSAMNRSAELMQKFKEQSSCEFKRFRPWQQSTSWPRNEHVVDIWDDLIVPQLENGIEFLPSDGRKHHIYNLTAFDLESVQNLKSLSRQNLVFNTLVLDDPQCREYFCKIFGNVLISCNNTKRSDIYHDMGKCIERLGLARNMAKIRIKLHSLMADVYEEKPSYEWTEALSEIGGTFGLWIGVSLLIVFEAMELLYVVISSCL